MTGWHHLVTVDTPGALLPAIADRLAADTLRHFADELAETDLDALMRQVAIERAGQILRRAALDAIVAAWWDLQIEAGRFH